MLRPSPKQLADKYGLIPKKALGQNFLFDLNITRKIVSYCKDISNKNVIEIGPGPGGLTTALLEKKPKSLTAIEFDPRAALAIKELGDVNIIGADALNFDLRTVASKPSIIVANLPYNIGTKLLMNWLEYANHFDYMVLMFQREVAERISAAPNSPEFGRLSVISQWLCETEILFDIPPEAFFPAPKVTSSVILIRPRPTPLVACDKKKLEDVLRAAFTKRRKMLKASLKTIIPNTEEALIKLGINPTARAQELSVTDFCKLAL